MPPLRPVAMISPAISWPALPPCTQRHVSNSFILQILSPLSNCLPLISPFTVVHTVYENIGKKYALEYPSTILACLSITVIIPIYIFYWKGEWFRERSKFAQELNAGRKGAIERRRQSSIALRNSMAMGGEKEGMRQRNVGDHEQGMRYVEQV